MKIGVVSDSHGHIENLRRAAQDMHEAGAEVIVHLGDDYDDVKALSEQEGTAIVHVPGVFSTYYQDPGIPNRVIEEWEGVRVLLTHTPEAHKNDLPTDLDPAAVVAREEVRVVLFGHSHIPEVREKEGVLWVNPGHVKDDDKKGYPPTYALLEITGTKIRVRIVDLYSGQELFEYP
jgi:putative phosphoesterase